MPALTLYPAIDLKAGACVRLRQGDMQGATSYSSDPAAIAQNWQDAGCSWLHVVDLDGAFAGNSRNAQTVAAILDIALVPVQLGGGLRDMAGIERWLAAGIARVILGSAALKNPGLVREACRLFPGQVAVGIDANGGFVATEGWAEISTVPALELALRFEDAGVAAIIYTDIARDGMLGGLNIDQTLALAARISTKLIASGGIGGLPDVLALQRASDQAPAPVEGVIIGRALYDGKLDFAQALHALAAGSATV